MQSWENMSLYQIFLIENSGGGGGSIFSFLFHPRRPILNYIVLNYKLARSVHMYSAEQVHYANKLHLYGHMQITDIG